MKEFLILFLLDILGFNIIFNFFLTQPEKSFCTKLCSVVQIKFRILGWFVAKDCDILKWEIFKAIVTTSESYNPLGRISIPQDHSERTHTIINIGESDMILPELYILNLFSPKIF